MIFYVMFCFAYNFKRKIKRLLKVCEQGFFSISKVNTFASTSQFLKHFKKPNVFRSVSGFPKKQVVSIPTSSEFP